MHNTRKPGKGEILFALIRIAAVLILFTLLIIISGASPAKAFRAFFTGIFGTTHGIAEVFVRAAPLILLGLGVAITFRSGFFNLGAEGQFYMGALASTAVVIILPESMGAVRAPIAALAAFIAGGIWVLLPALMKNFMGISETVNTIMFNYIATMFVGIAIRSVLQEPGSSLPQTASLPENVHLPLLLYPTRLHAGIIIAVVAAFLVWFLLYKTTLGFEMQMVGLSRRAAFVTGFPVTKALILSALIGGGLSGLAGFNEVFGVQHRLLEGVSSGNGFTAILVALLAGNHPVRVLFVAIGLAMLQVGTASMQRALGVPSAIVSIIIGFIVLMILFGKLPAIRKELHPLKKAL
ncbi:MAG: ABC transporter permease [Lachnospiraceae bacterium]|nr:ABC transporter permease [Lachnospiraceae bacterium]